MQWVGTGGPRTAGVFFVLVSARMHHTPASCTISHLLRLKPQTTTHRFGHLCTRSVRGPMYKSSEPGSRLSVDIVYAIHIGLRYWVRCLPTPIVSPCALVPHCLCNVVALTFFRSLKTFRLTFLRMRNKYKNHQCPAKQQSIFSINATSCSLTLL